MAEYRRGEKDAVAQTQVEKELTQAKLSLLHAQVEPHFLYNTLASAQLLTRSDPERAEQMLGHLIQYLRRSLPRTQDTPSTLGDELERAVAYLEILKIRMGHRLTVQVDVPESLRATPMPAMMLQTLVENAIKHGLEPRTAGGTVWIRARANDDTVAITVADDGNGFNTTTGGTGIGLKNVRERLRLMFGGNASLAVVANFPAGVAATISVPAAPGTVHASHTAPVSPAAAPPAWWAEANTASPAPAQTSPAAPPVITPPAAEPPAVSSTPLHTPTANDAASTPTALPGHPGPDGTHGHA
ncbi:sensor histidine kinase [Lysobacter olei]